ncbi:hypothetical protein QP157_07400 [Sphingomonas sp. LR61]|uniref:hypothetical protein n=1 Tax=Sphingomonas sp. LR61 TaxID=3050234 RepID=UPI002FDFC10D
MSILLQPHSGTDPRPIGKGASGGELSRVMLAIEVVMAGSTTVPTFVFDEVDAGVGGAAAIEIGRRLAKLAERTQVIVVTHLAQVAAFANNHLNVVKDASGAVTSSSVRRLEGDDRLQEMARLLSGLGDSASGVEHARELLDVAGQDGLTDHAAASTQARQARKYAGKHASTRAHARTARTPGHPPRATPTANPGRASRQF